jgi:hypothetical protein
MVSPAQRQAFEDIIESAERRGKIEILEHLMFIAQQDKQETWRALMAEIRASLDRPLDREPVKL